MANVTVNGTTAEAKDLRQRRRETEAGPVWDVLLLDRVLDTLAQPLPGVQEEPTT